MSNEQPFIVLGAGPAGLTAARTLSRAGEKVIVLEKESSVGGISSSRRWNGFITEYGPHTYHVKNDRIDEIVREHYPGTLPIKKRVTRMLIRGKFFNYPLKFWQLLRDPMIPSPPGGPRDSGRRFMIFASDSTRKGSGGSPLPGSPPAWPARSCTS
jgi:protoporphyrinogen oxidase